MRSAAGGIVAGVLVLDRLQHLLVFGQGGGAGRGQRVADQAAGDVGDMGEGQHVLAGAYPLVMTTLAPSMLVSSVSVMVMVVSTEVAASFST